MSEQRSLAVFMSAIFASKQIEVENVEVVPDNCLILSDNVALSMRKKLNDSTCNCAPATGATDGVSRWETCQNHSTVRPAPPTRRAFLEGGIPPCVFNEGCISSLPGIDEGECMEWSSPCRNREWSDLDFSNHSATRAPTRKAEETFLVLYDLLEPDESSLGNSSSRLGESNSTFGGDNECNYYIHPAPVHNDTYITDTGTGTTLTGRNTINTPCCPASEVPPSAPTLLNPGETPIPEGKVGRSNWFTENHQNRNSTTRMIPMGQKLAPNVTTSVVA